MKASRKFARSRFLDEEKAPQPVDNSPAALDEAENNEIIEELGFASDVDSNEEND